MADAVPLLARHAPPLRNFHAILQTAYSNFSQYIRLSARYTPCFCQLTTSFNQAPILLTSFERGSAFLAKTISVNASGLPGQALVSATQIQAGLACRALELVVAGAAGLSWLAFTSLGQVKVSGAD